MTAMPAECGNNTPHPPHPYGADVLGRNHCGGNLHRARYLTCGYGCVTPCEHPTPTRARTVMQTNQRGEYVPAIPVPWLDPFLVRCSESGCEESWRHWTRRGRRRALRCFREHYAYVHILALD